MMEKGLTLKQGQTHVQKYTKPLLEMIEEGKIDTTFLISHHAPLEQAARDVPPLARRTGYLHQDRPEDGNGNSQAGTEGATA